MSHESNGSNLSMKFELSDYDDIREDLLIALPVNPLCSNKCLGLCNQCGVDLNNESCDCGSKEDVADNIWGDLDKLDFGD